MSSETNNLSLRVPVIDFSVQPHLKPKTPEWESVRAQIKQALEKFGCFEALFDKIPLEMQRETFEAIKELYDLPLETKQLNISPKPFNSYSYGQKTNGKLQFEAITIDEANVDQKVKTFADILWPQGNPSFCKAIHSYSEQLSGLDDIIQRMVFEGLGIEKYWEEHLESTNYIVRVMKYEESQMINGTKQLALPGHTDKNLLTILNQNQVDGLEIQTKDGQWICVNPSPGSFIVMSGEALSGALANGRLHCPRHRVMLSGKKTRYSIGLFSLPKEDYLIKTPEELVDEEHPLMFKPYYYLDYVRFLTNYGTKFALKDYCGI